MDPARDLLLSRPGPPDVDDLVTLYQACHGRHGRRGLRPSNTHAYATTLRSSTRGRRGAREGLGTRLLAFVEERAREQGSRDGYVRQNVTSRNPAARDLLESHGYVPSHHYARFEIDLTMRPVVPTAPAGVTVRPYVVGADDVPVHAAFNRAWSQYEGERWEPESLERWLENVAAETFDPATWHVAEEDGAVVAFCLCDQYPDLGWVQYLGTVPEARGRGLARLLLLHAFATYFDRGVTRLGLTVSSANLPAARALYDAVGMREVLRYDNLEKPLG